MDAVRNCPLNEPFVYPLIKIWQLILLIHSKEREIKGKLLKDLRTKNMKKKKNCRVSEMTKFF